MLNDDDWWTSEDDIALLVVLTVVQAKATACLADSVVDDAYDLADAFERKRLHRAERASEGRKP